MANIDQRLRDFFADYEKLFNKALAGAADIEATAAAFADCFVGANPMGVSCGENNTLFRSSIAQGFDFYRSAGNRSITIGSVKITPLDDYHHMAKVRWNAFYVKKDGGNELIGFDVIYLVQTIGESPKIFAHITGDEQKALRERGLMPG